MTDQVMLILKKEEVKISGNEKGAQKKGLPAPFFVL